MLNLCGFRARFARWRRTVWGGIFMQLHYFDFNLLQLQFVVLYYTGFFSRTVGTLLFGAYTVSLDFLV